MWVHGLAWCVASWRVEAGGFRVLGGESGTVAWVAHFRRGLSPTPPWPITHFNSSFDASRRVLACIWRMVAPSIRCFASKFQENSHHRFDPTPFQPTSPHRPLRWPTRQPLPTMPHACPQPLRDTRDSHSTVTHRLSTDNPTTSHRDAHTRTHTLPNHLSYPTTHSPTTQHTSVDSISPA